MEDKKINNENMLNANKEIAEVYEEIGRMDGKCEKWNRMCIVYSLTERFIVFNFYYN